MSQSLDKPLDRGKLLHRRLICLLLASMRQVPGLGAVVELAMGWQQAAMELRQQQDKQSLEERVSQLEEAMRIPPGEIKSLAVEVIDQQRRQGLAISADRAKAIVEIAGYLPATIRERVQSTLHQARHYGTALQTVLPLDDSASEMEKNEFDRALLPRRRPRFQSGDKVLEGPPQWRLTELIGTGSFGEVWQAYHRQMRRYFAVKFCHDEVSAKILVREAETLITLHERLPDHPQVVKLVELQLEVEPYWLAFEYVQGGTLESLMRAKQFGWQEAVQLVASLCRGMAAVHDIGIVHRDLKPENILLTAEGVPRITDFGIGKIIVEQESKTRLQEGTILAGAGTPVYASSEQLRGLAAEPTDDVYSLGVILWQLLVHSLEVPRYVKVSLQEASAPIPEAVQQIVLSCIDCPRKHRPANAKVLLQQLETVLGNSPVQAQQSQPQSPPSKSPPVSSPQSVSGLERLPIAQSDPVQIEEFEFEVVTVQIGKDGQLNKQTRRAKNTQYVYELGKGVRLELVHIPAGEFMMGSPATEKGRYDDEGPQHKVKIARPFAMGKYPITQAQYEAIMGKNPSHFKGAQRPVETVSWDECNEFRKRLSERLGVEFKLPSEAQWEYACRAGTTTAYSFGDEASQLGNYAWYTENSGEKTHPVGEKKPNAWGLYDMHGNVWEWCEDLWHSNYEGAPTDGSAWMSGGTSDERPLRGGSWGDYGDWLRCATRYGDDSTNGLSSRGLRLSRM